RRRRRRRDHLPGPRLRLLGRDRREAAHDRRRARAGKVYLVSGRNGQTLRTFTGTVAGAELGFDVVLLGDVDGDGVPDVLITGSQVAYVVLGKNCMSRAP